MLNIVVLIYQNVITNVSHVILTTFPFFSTVSIEMIRDLIRR